MNNIRKYLKTENGDSELVGLLVAIVFFAAIIFGGGTAWQHHQPKGFAVKEIPSLQDVYAQQYLDVKDYGSYGGTDEFAKRNPSFKTEFPIRVYIWAEKDEFCAVGYNPSENKRRPPAAGSDLVARSLKIAPVTLVSVDQNNKIDYYESVDATTNGGCANKIPPFGSNAAYIDSTGYHAATAADEDKTN